MAAPQTFTATATAMPPPRPLSPSPSPSPSPSYFSPCHGHSSATLSNSPVAGAAAATPTPPIPRNNELLSTTCATDASQTSQTSANPAVNDHSTAPPYYNTSVPTSKSRQIPPPTSPSSFFSPTPNSTSPKNATLGISDLKIPPSQPATPTTTIDTSPISPARPPQSPYSSASQTAIEPLRQFPTDLTAPIPEEGDEETGSESFPNEPVTPVSGRQSRDFRCRESQDLEQNHTSLAASYSSVPENAGVPLQFAHFKEAPNTPDVLGTPPSLPSYAPLPTPRTPNGSLNRRFSNSAKVTSAASPAATPKTPLRRRSSASLILVRAMSALFKRNTSNGVENGNTGATMEFKEPNYDAGTPETTVASASKVPPSSAGHRRFSYHRSVATTRSNTPPSPGSLIDPKANGANMPTSGDFFDNNIKKHRAHTGLSLSFRDTVNFVTTKTPRRTRSVERHKKTENEKTRQRQHQHQHQLQHLTRQPWAIPPDAGTGMKARRLSLSLPDDFTVDVAELQKEYEYQHKLFGRHGKHLGKGATSKVKVMARKGSPGELYAVKEFRSKTSSETTEDYENKIKSEYSIAKSLHHPNIVETIRLCTDHGRWNHVMEYCSEGDLFSLVSKKFLKEESRDVDRMCLFKQLCQGINYLHTNGIAHRDIKLENLLITKESKLKITDFGVSEVFSGIHPGIREAGGQCGMKMGDIRLCKPGICGSLPYIAPEVVGKKTEYDPRPLDVWSSAVVMIYLIFNANLWEKAEDTETLTPNGPRTYHELVSGWSRIETKRAEKPDDEHYKEVYPKVTAFEYFVKPVGLRRLLLNMLHPDPAKRISMRDVVNNRWMKNVECCQLESYEDPTKFIDASKKDCMKGLTGSKIFCHNHLPPVAAAHGLPPMPGKPGY